MAWHGSDKPYSITYEVDFSHPDYNRTSEEHTEYYITEDDALRDFNTLMEDANVQNATLFRMRWEDREIADPQGQLHKYKVRVYDTLNTYARPT